MFVDVADEAMAAPPAPTVVLVDDNHLFRDTVRELLVARGVSVVGEAGDGATGLKLVVELRPEVCLLDRRLPDVDGFELIDAFRRDAPTTEVVVLTGYPDATAERGEGRHGAYAFLVKPCPPDLLVDTVTGAAAYGRRER